MVLLSLPLVLLTTIAVLVFLLPPFLLSGLAGLTASVQAGVPALLLGSQEQHFRLLHPTKPNEHLT